MPSPSKALATKLKRAHARGAGWNWVYWRATIRSAAGEIVLAGVPARYVHAIEAGTLTVGQAALFLASRDRPSLESFTPFVPLWRDALQTLLHIREDARQAALFGQAALDLALEGKYAEAFDAAWRAAEVERAYSGRPVRWRGLLYLLAEELVRSGHGYSRDIRVQSAAEASSRTARSRSSG